jgi:Uma2 family endonuclease
MSTLHSRSQRIDYPTTDGKPMAETELHRDLMFDLIKTLQAYYVDQKVYVSGNLLVFYVDRDKRRHVSPDVFVVRGVEKHQRDYYPIWQEGKGPEVVIELTSRSTEIEDLEDKYNVYLQLRVAEYFLFDPRAEDLRTPLHGFRLRGGRFVQIRPVEERLPSKVLGLHLERHDTQLRLYNPPTERWLPTPEEAQAQAEAEVRRLRRQVEALQRGNGRNR